MNENYYFIFFYRKRKRGGGYGVRREAGEGDRVRCFCQQNWGQWVHCALKTSSSCKQVAWSRNSEGRGIRFDVLDRTVCFLTHRNRTAQPPPPHPPVSLSWTGLLPCSSTDFWIRLPASEDTLRMWTKESWGGVNTQLHGNKMQGSVWLVCIWSRPFFLEPPFSLFCRISICNWRQEMSH